jgi:secondary thiamine-phosphate synthase enzyme
VIFQQHTLEIETTAKGFTNVTAQLKRLALSSGIREGLCHVFIQHTSASLLIQENADPAVLRDLGRWFSELAPESRRWEHDDEGADDMPAHARSSVTRTSETIPIRAGQLALGTWQGVYVWEHRSRAYRRTLIVSLQGI